MSKPLPGRVERLELIRGPMPASEAAELAQLERDYAARFSGSIDDWPVETVDAYLSFQASDTAARIDELRQRRKSPQQRAEDAAMAIAIAAMDRDQLDEFMTALLDAHFPQEPPA